MHTYIGRSCVETHMIIDLLTQTDDLFVSSDPQKFHERFDCNALHKTHSNTILLQLRRFNT